MDIKLASSFLKVGNNQEGAAQTCDCNILKNINPITEPKILKMLPSGWKDFKISNNSRTIFLKKRPILRAYVKMWLLICFFSYSFLFYITYLFLLLVGASLHEKCPVLRDSGACGLRYGGRTFKLDSWCMQSSGIFV